MPMSTFGEGLAAGTGPPAGEVVWGMGGSGTSGEASMEEAIARGRSRNQTAPEASPAMTVVALTATAR
jgi:hypothetical protein